jgi:hypothetical protein
MSGYTGQAGLGFFTFAPFPSPALEFGLAQAHQYDSSDALLVSFTQSGSSVILIGVFTIGPATLTSSFAPRVTFRQVVML